MNYYSINEILESEQIVIFGCGRIGKSLYSILKKKNGNICAATDNDKEKWGKHLGKINIISPEVITEKYKGALYCVANAKYCDEIEKQLNGLGITSEKIIKIDQERIIYKALVESGKHSGENRFLIYDLPYPENTKTALCNILYKLMDIRNQIELKCRNVPGGGRKNIRFQYVRSLKMRRPI